MPRRLLPLLALLVLPACGSGSDGPEERTPEPFYDANAAAGIDADAAMSDRQAQTDEAIADVEAGRGTPLGFKGEIQITPAEVFVGDTIEAKVRLIDGASAFTDIDWEWTLNGRVLRNVSRSTLTPSVGYVKGDVITVKATAIDERGNVETKEGPRIVIANSVPRILTDASKRYGLDGLRMEAEDDDGDELTWSIEAGPPGVEIDRRGRVTVRQVDIQEAFNGEVVIAATDTSGARAEFHVPVNVNAAVEEVREAFTTTTERHVGNMTEDEYEKANLDAAERVEQMSEEELREYWADQERREDERAKQD